MLNLWCIVLLLIGTAARLEEFLYDGISILPRAYLLLLLPAYQYL